MAADDEHEKVRFPHPPEAHENSLAGSSKTFLKPFVKGVASAGRSVGAGIYHAGKVVDAISDLTDRISLPRTAGSPHSSSASHPELAPPMDSSDNVLDARREKSRLKGKFKSAGNYGPGNSSDTGSDGYMSQAPLSRLSPLPVSRDNFPHLDSHISRGRYSRAHTDHVGLQKCDLHEEGEGHLTNNSEDDGPAAVYTYEALLPKSRVSSTICKIPFAKRRHTIQIPQDYNLVPVRHSTKKQNLEVQLVWKYRLLKKMEQKQRSILEAFEVLEGQYHSTAKEAELKSREVKDRLEGYVEHNKMATELLSFSPNNPFLSSHSTASSTTSSEHQRQPSGDVFPTNPFHQPRQPAVSLSSKAMSWDKVDPETWELYKELASAGEVLRQRRHEVSHKRRMMDNHVQELIKQAGLKRPARRRDHPSRRQPSVEEKAPAGVTDDQEQHKGVVGKTEKWRSDKAISRGRSEEAGVDSDYHGSEEETGGGESGWDESRLVITMARGVVHRISRDPSVQVLEFIELVVVAGVRRLVDRIAAGLVAGFRAAVRFLLVCFLRLIRSIATSLDLHDPNLAIPNPIHNPASIPLLPQKPPTPLPSES